MTWTTSNIPSQKERLFVITGANAGLGLATARALSANGAEIVMAVRNVEKGKKAADAIRAAQPDAKLHVIPLDLSQLDSVRAFAATFQETFSSLDVLINNAGLYTSGSQTTAEGFALMMGVNHLGHFALTGLLLDRLLATSGSRIVTLSSGAYRSGKLDLDRFHTVEEAASGAYGKSKLANMLFMLELQRRLTQIDAETISVAVGPGPTKSDGAQEGIQSISNPVLRRLADGVTNILMASSEEGALPTLRAATDLEAKGGDYYTLNGFMGMRGSPAATQPNLSADQIQLAKELWERSVALTGVDYLGTGPSTSASE